MGGNFEYLLASLEFRVWRRESLPQKSRKEEKSAGYSGRFSYKTDAG